MRVLLDENLPYRLRQLFENPIEVVTVGYRGWKGKRNGELLSIVSTEFDAFITMDMRKKKGRARKPARTILNLV